MNEKLPKTPEEWQIHDDAHTLLRAQEVRLNKDRLKAALNWIKYLEDETISKANAVKALIKEKDKLNN